MDDAVLPQSDITRQLLADGAIGEVHLVMADFGFVAPFDPANRMWDPSVGGGALLDEVYIPSSSSFASSVIGAPSAITAAGAMTSTGVDARAAIQLTTPSGAHALVATSMVSALPVRATIVGSAGRIEIPSRFSADRRAARPGLHRLGDDARVDGHRVRDPPRGSLPSGDRARVVRRGGPYRVPLHGLDETVSILGTIDEARARWPPPSRWTPEPPEPRRLSTRR